MSAMFTQHAFERMRERGVAPGDIDSLLATIERMAANPDGLGKSQDVVRVTHRDGEEAFIVRAGDIRAVVTVDSAKPDNVFVLSVYRADRNSSKADTPLPASRQARDFA